MADPVLKFPPEQKGSPPAPSRPKVAAEPRRRLLAGMRRYRRLLLLVVLPLVALIAGVVFYLNGGRYVTTDDAYVGAQKVLITPDISGKIDKVVVKEGQQVKTGDVLFEIDPVPFRLAVDAGQGRRSTRAKTSYDNLVANIKIYGQMLDLAQQGIELKQRDVERKIVAGQEQCRLAARSRQCRRPRWSPRARRRSSSSSSSPTPKPSCSAIPNCRWSSFRPTPRPRPHSTRPSAISTTP